MNEDRNVTLALVHLFMLQGSIGALEHWSNNTIFKLQVACTSCKVHWSIGALEHWSIGALEHWSIGARRIQSEALTGHEKMYKPLTGRRGPRWDQ